MRQSLNLDRSFNHLAGFSQQSRVVTIQKINAHHYNLIELVGRRVIMSEIPFKLTAERLMSRVNSKPGLSIVERRQYQFFCHEYARLLRDLEHAESLLGSDCEVKRRLAKIKCYNLDCELAKIEKILLVDDK
jgi:hypothetical protein